MPPVVGWIAVCAATFAPITTDARSVPKIRIRLIVRLSITLPPFEVNTNLFLDSKAATSVHRLARQQRRPCTTYYRSFALSYAIKTAPLRIKLHPRGSGA